MATIQITPPAQSTALRDRPHYLVYTRASWADDWEPIDYLEVLHASFPVAPSIPRAVFRYRAGEIKREDIVGAGAWVTYPLPDLRDKFVRIDLLPAAIPGQPTPAASIFWVGVFVDKSIDTLGDARGPAADADYVAFGVQHLLDRTNLRVCYATNDNETYVRIDAPLDFNAESEWGPRRLGNRSGSKIGGGDAGDSYVFADRSDVWSALDILEYLAVRFAPAGMKIRIEGQTDALAAYEPPMVQYGGRTAWSLACQVVDRHRGLGFLVDATGQDNVVRFRAFTTVAQDVAVGDATVPANPIAQDVDFDAAGHLYGGAYGGSVQISFDSLATFDRIVVAGEAMVSMCSLSNADGTLLPGWTTAEENAYKAASDEERVTERHRHAFTCYMLPESWDYTAGNGQSGSSAVPKRPVNPITNQGSIENSTATNSHSRTRRWGRRFLRQLPLRKPNDPDRSDPEFLEPLAFLYTEPVPPEEVGTWRSLNNPASPNAVSGQFRMLDTEQGVEALFYPAHKLALNHWDGAVESPLGAPQYDYAKMVVTVAMELDHRPNVVVDLKPGLSPDIDPARTLYIEVPGAHLWWCTPGTVTDIRDEKLYSATPQELQEAMELDPATPYHVLRDDGPYLRQIAALAKAWYGTERAVLRAVAADVPPGFVVGSMIRQVTSGGEVYDVNSVVSCVSVDFQSMTSEVTTGWGELDVRAFGMSRTRMR